MRRGQLGVSLVEAIVAMAVMAFGMLAVVGLQSTMRQNSDIAKQRSEAVRIAQEAVEDWRSFSTIPTTPSQTSFADIATAADQIVTGYTTNTAYTLQRSVSGGLAAGMDQIRVNVSWQDRAGDTQAVQLSSIIAAADPALSAVLSIAPSGKPLKMPLDRNTGIPVTAVDRGDGKSAWKPPGTSDVVLLLDNLTGVVTSVCTYPGTDLATFDTSICVSQPSFLISGFVRFALGPTPTPLNPTDYQIDLAVQAVATAGDSSDGVCYAAPVAGTSPLTFTFYSCVVPRGSLTTWTGRTLLAAPLDLSAYDVCRYSQGMAYDAAKESAFNADHPAEYKHLAQSLGNQNFLVVTQGVGCPSVAPALTQPHQPPF